MRIIASQRKPEASEELGRTRVAGKRWDAEAMKELQRPVRRSTTPKPEAVPDDTTEVKIKDDFNADANSKSNPGSDSTTDTSTAAAVTNLEPAPPPRIAKPFRPWTVAPAEEEAVLPDQQEEESGAGEGSKFKYEYEYECECECRSVQDEFGRPVTNSPT